MRSWYVRTSCDGLKLVVPVVDTDDVVVMDCAMGGHVGATPTVSLCVNSPGYSGQVWSRSVRRTPRLSSRSRLPVGGPATPRYVFLLGAAATLIGAVAVNMATGHAGSRAVGDVPETDKAARSGVHHHKDHQIRLNTSRYESCCQLRPHHLNGLLVSSIKVFGECPAVEHLAGVVDRLEERLNARAHQRDKAFRFCLVLGAGKTQR